MHALTKGNLIEPYLSNKHQSASIIKIFLENLEEYTEKYFGRRRIKQLIDFLGKPWQIAEETDSHDPDKNRSQVVLFFHRSAPGSFVRNPGEYWDGFFEACS